MYSFLCCTDLGTDMKVRIYKSLLNQQTLFISYQSFMYFILLSGYKFYNAGYLLLQQMPLSNGGVDSNTNSEVC